MKVWIVSRGTMHEGGSVVAVVDSKEKGLAYVAEHFGDYKRVSEEPDMISWTSGCDFVDLDEHEVD
jgi:hypothetical protein